MPLKRGGGNHMQLYDSNDGKYTDEEKESMKSYDDFALQFYEIYGEKSDYKFHFPIEGIHEKRYCERFVKAIRDDIHEPTYVEQKMNYLFTFKKDGDKSNFLKNEGFSDKRPYELFNELCKFTKRNSIEFAKFSFNKLIVTAKTILNGKLIKTIWRLEPNLDLYFITLIPGGDKKWKK